LKDKLKNSKKERGSVVANDDNYDTDVGIKDPKPPSADVMSRSESEPVCSGSDASSIADRRYERSWRMSS